MKQLFVVILAAGKGKRMVSDLPKVLHKVGDIPLLGHVLATAEVLGATARFVVCGYGSEVVKATFSSDEGIVWVEQTQQFGTGHAVAQVIPLLDKDGVVLVLYGDVPMIQPNTLQPLIEEANRGCLALLTAELANPTGYGRIIRDGHGCLQRIVEEKDTNPIERCLREINTGIMAISVEKLRSWLTELSNDNAQGEYYLPGIIDLAVRDDVPVKTFTATEPAEVRGINNRMQLVEMERFYQERQAKTLLANGVTLLDPKRFDIRGSVITGRDVVINVDVVFEGTVTLGSRVTIGPFCLLRDVTIGDDVEILSHCRIEGAIVGDGARVGPFARLRPYTQLAAGVHIGNFVETKNVSVDYGSKINHLTYIGDAEIGSNVNIGAGTITCNYDSINKHKTIIEDGAFIGSNSSLVAPVRIGKGATVGAGSAVNRDVPDSSLCLTRAHRRDIINWKRPV